MLAGPHPPTHATSNIFYEAMERRGRSRAVSKTAAIRKSHPHQRQLYYSHYPSLPPSPSPSPIRSPQSDDSASPQSTPLEPITPPELSLDYYESPPTPPQCLEDQIHEAYALDNIHLAKILYLKLQGVHVVDDSDPRIQQVREEDFPFETLTLDEEDERTLKECQSRERHRKRDQLRAIKLVQCERAWDQSTAEYRQQCLLVRRRKQARTLVLADRLDTVEDEHQHRTLGHLSCTGARSLLTYKPPTDDTTRSAPSRPPALAYSVPTNPSSPVDIPCRSPKSFKLHRGSPVLSPTHSVPFRQVSACMNGPLFPDDDVPCDHRSRKRQSHAHTTLLEVLLQPVTWERGERSDLRSRRGSTLPSFNTWSSNGTLCSAHSPDSGSPSTIVSSHSGRQFDSIRRLTISISNPTTCASPPRVRPTPSGAYPLTPINLQDGPLSFPMCSLPPPQTPLLIVQQKSRSPFATRLVRKLGNSVSTFMDIAAQFQASYVRTAGSIAYFETESPYYETAPSSWGVTSFLTPAKTWLPFDPTNPRAKISEVVTFLEGSTWSVAKDEDDHEPEHYTLVQLLSPSERCLPPPSTSAYIAPSPLRPRDVPTGLRYRIRPVANPVLLRLKALQNVCACEGVEWEGRAREGSLGYGRDRLQGVAFDGIGRSRLSWEVSF